MPDDVDALAVADAVLTSVGVLVRRVRQLPTDDDLTTPERSALKRLADAGLSTSAEMARAAQISPQSMNTTVAALTRRGLVRRDSDPADGRRVMLSITPAGQILLQGKRNTRSRQLADVLTEGFTATEMKRLLAAAPLIERLARDL
ncbi:DNA-binding transcriptional regulator, MarR family [Nakamurella panacisegetis]|uniref:DNA-binding transcriptional regulator, MarR family n=1 Tax=Nakamurella panacisegetis TaxID=1090615 RepID=A0A1H0LMP3_9ACTN|nr:MarR family transcriptional regulator [Nakamurella panacisegetis]SDO69492.1 DNA-binding transcriptional regulator, MarR family [Nakamurella panacisegetis]